MRRIIFSLEAAMLGRFKIDGVTGSTNSVDPALRSDVTLGGTPQSVELPQSAVSEVPKSQSLAKELPPHIHEKAKVFGQIQQSMKELELKVANSKELEAIRAKLLLGHEKAKSNDITHPAVAQALKSADNIHLLGNHSKTEWPGLKKTETPQRDNQIQDPNVAGQADQQKVIGRIDDALMAVDKLLGQLDGEKLAENTRLLNLTGTVVGLNAARSTVDKTQLSLSVAMNAAEMIMTNVKAAVMSHANINTDIVRLVMA
jgi:hypothetical protein